MNIINNLLLWLSDRVMDAKVSRFIDIVVTGESPRSHIIVACDYNANGNRNTKYGHHLIYNSTKFKAMDQIFIRGRAKLNRRQKAAFFKNIESLSWSDIFDYVDCSDTKMLRELVIGWRLNQVVEAYDLPPELIIELQLKGLM